MLAFSKCRMISYSGSEKKAKTHCQPAPVEIYEDLRDFILKFDNLERLYLIGIALVDHL